MKYFTRIRDPEPSLSNLTERLEELARGRITNVIAERFVHQVMHTKATKRENDLK